MGNCRFFTLFSKKACNSLFSMIIYFMFRKEMPACRNGRRGRLKICCGQPRAGSSPAAGSIKTPNSCKSWSLVFFLYSVFLCIPTRKYAVSYLFYIFSHVSLCKISLIVCMDKSTEAISSAHLFSSFRMISS